VARILSRLGLGASAQLISAGNKILLSVAVARTASPAQFGAFAIAFAATVLALTVARALIAEPLSITLPRGNSDRRAVSDGATGAALLLGLGLGLVFVSVGLVIGADLGRLLIVFGCLQPAVLLQEVWRYIFVAEGNPRAAALNDSIWLAFTLVLLFLTQTTRVSFTDAIVLWGIGAAASAAFGAHQAGAVPRPRKARDFLARHRFYWSRIGPEQVVSASSWQIGLVLVATIAGLEAAGALRAAQTALGPAGVFISAASLALVPELARLDAEDSSIAGWARASSFLLGSLTVIAGVVLLNLPAVVGEWFLGSSWSAARAILPAMTLFLASTGINMGFLSGLRALGAVHRSLRVRLFMSPLHVGALTLGTAAAGLGVGVAALAIVNLAAGFIWAEQFRRAVRDREKDRHCQPCPASEEVLQDNSTSA